MRQHLAMLSILILTACQPAAGSDQSATLAPTLSSLEVTANVRPLECSSGVETTYYTPSEGYPNPTELFLALTEQPSGTFDGFMDGDSTSEIIWVFADDIDRKTGQIRAVNFPNIGWAVVSLTNCAGERVTNTDATQTAAPIPANEATAAAMPLNCADSLSEMSVMDYGYDPDATPTGPFTPQEALADYAEHGRVFSYTPSYTHITETRTTFVYLNSEGRIVQRIHAETTEWGTWIISSYEACSPLE